MFCDSEIAAKFSLSKTKCGYYINYGLAPYFKDKLVKEVKNSPYFTVQFDESLNKIFQKEQMDAQVRYWCEESHSVKTAYFDSKFFNRPNCDNIVKAINEVIKPLEKKRMINLGMDGPNTNWAVLTKIQGERKEEELSQLENIGSCGLHVIAGALQTGVSKTSWNLKKVLQSMFKLFNDSPARREVYIKLSGTDKFAIRFCPTRWTENESVAERAINVWDAYVSVIEYYSKLCASKQPQKNKSYDTLQAHYTDKLMKVKFQAFKDIAHKLNQFLTVFQTDAPMLPFLSDILESLLRRIMRYFIRSSVVAEAATPYKLIGLDVSATSENCLPVNDLKLTTAVKSILKELKCTGGQKHTFLKDYRNFLIGLVEKMQEQSPLSYALVRSSSSLNPVKMASEEAASIVKFGNIVDKLYEHGRLGDQESDDAKSQYSHFMETVMRQNKNEFSNFDYTLSRVDEFFSKYIEGNKKYEKMWKVFKFIFVLSHGQATIERGFNVNKDVLVDNMQELSMVSQRLVYDQINGEDISKINIPREMIHSCKGAHQRYVIALKEKADSATSEDVSRKRKAKKDEILEVKRRKMEVEKLIDSMKGDIEIFSVEASDKSTFEDVKVLLDKANAFRQAVKEKQLILTDLDTALNKLEEESKT